MNMIRESNGIALVGIESKFYVVEIAGSPQRGGRQVYSVGTDSPKSGGRWFAGYSEAGIRYVATGRTRAAANRIYRRETLA